MANQEMTYSEATNYLLHCADEAKSKDWASGIKFALATIEKATEQEPCEDCISRQAVIDAMFGLCDDGENPHIDAIADTIERIPSVTPQPKTGRWIEHFNESGKWYECDQCHTDWGGSVNYCPNCGARMAESEE